MTWDRSQAEDVTRLSPQECLHLLRRVEVGRVGLSLGALPTILPVPFVVVGDDVIVSSPGSKFDAALSGNVVCFEADDLDPLGNEAWSVVVTGRGALIRPEEERQQPELVALRAQEAGSGSLIRIRADLVSGQRNPLGRLLLRPNA